MSEAEDTTHYQLLNIKHKILTTTETHHLVYIGIDIAYKQNVIPYSQKFSQYDIFAVLADDRSGAKI